VVVAVKLTYYASTQRFDSQLHFSPRIGPFGADWTATVPLSRYYRQLDMIGAQVGELATAKGGRAKGTRRAGPMVCTGATSE
jgi:hypothetical protein